jgi:hypothetical protein
MAALALERPLRVAWELHRLRSDPERFRPCLHAEPGSIARAAMERFLREPEGKQRVAGMLLEGIAGLNLVLPLVTTQGKALSLRLTFTPSSLAYSLRDESRRFSQATMPLSPELADVVRSLEPFRELLPATGLSLSGYAGFLLDLETDQTQRAVGLSIHPAGSSPGAP